MNTTTRDQQTTREPSRPVPPLRQAPLLQASDLIMDYSAAAASSGIASDHAATGIMPGSPATLALNHVNFMLAQGESVAVMGPSGSGKSTLLHVLAGIVKPTSGSVRFRGAELAGMSERDRTKLRRSAFGFVFQSGQLLPELPAVENIALPLMLGGVDYRHATDAAVLWLERLGLRQLAAHRPGEMSGGQMQRVAIARALCVNPAVVFADEPTGALDQATGREVMGLLMQACRANDTSVVVVTHDPSVAAFCGTTVHMRDGHLFTQNTVRNAERDTVRGSEPNAAIGAMGAVDAADAADATGNATQPPVVRSSAQQQAPAQFVSPTSSSSSSSAVRTEGTSR